MTSYLCPKCEFESNKNICEFCGSATIECDELYEQVVVYQCVACQSIVRRRRHVTTEDAVLEHPVVVQLCPRCQRCLAHVVYIERTSKLYDYSDVLEILYNKELKER